MNTVLALPPSRFVPMFLAVVAATGMVVSKVIRRELHSDAFQTQAVDAALSVGVQTESGNAGEPLPCAYEQAIGVVVDNDAWVVQLSGHEPDCFTGPNALGCTGIN